MTKRNDPCPCGSGRKYKKCCESKQTVTVEDVQSEEMERLLQTFYDTYPKREDIPSFIEFADSWKSELADFLPEEMIEAITLDEFFFHERTDIWKKYMEKQKKQLVRPSMQVLLEQWRDPRLFIGEVTEVGEAYITAVDILGRESIHLWRESEKPIPSGVHFYCFILPDGTEEQHVLAVSSLIFFPVDHSEAIKEFASSTDTLKGQSMNFWKMLADHGYAGDEFTVFESGVLQAVDDFLKLNERSSDRLTEIVEDFLVEQQPNARKEVAIAAGAVRFGQEHGLFEPLVSSWKDIAGHFGVSPSSMNRYAKEIEEYAVKMSN